MNELALFAGAGGGILGGHLLGWRCICAVEIDAYARRVLLARQDDGSLPPFPVWDDVCTFDGAPWRGRADVVSGGFPCQDISLAGKGEGITGARSGLWAEMARIIREVEPRFVLVENSPALTVRGLGAVLGDLASMGFNAEWGVFSAAAVGAPHQRDRLWILAAHPDRAREPQPQGREQDERGWAGDGAEETADPDRERLQELRRPVADEAEHGAAQCASWWTAEPDVVRMVHGVAHGVDRIGCLGNGQVPAVVRQAWRVLLSRIMEAL